MGTKRTVGDVPSCTPTLVAGEIRGEQITKSGWFADFLHIASIPAVVRGSSDRPVV